jgi:Spy/CpxP family protein refolding chaperone
MTLVLLAAVPGQAAGLCEGKALPFEQRPAAQAAPQASHKKGDKPDKGNKPDDRQGPLKWWIDAKLRADLGITDQQSAAVDAVWQKTAPGLREARLKLDKLEDTLSEMTQRDGADDAAVIAQIALVENTRAEANKARTLMIYRMNKILNADQRAKVKAMHERRDPPRRGSSSR